MFTFWAKVIAHPELTLTRGRRLSGTTWDKAASVKATSPGDVSKAICLQALVHCKRRRRSTARQSRDMDSPAKSGALGGESAEYELGEEPHALRLAGLSLSENPDRSIQV